MRLGKKIVVIFAALGLLLAPGLATAAMDTQTVAGEAYGTRVDALGVSQDKTPHAALEDGAVMDEADALSTSVPGVVEAENLFSTTTGASTVSGTSAESSSTLESLDVLDGLITAESVVAISSSAISGDGAASSADGSSFSNLVVNGVAIDPDVAPNTRIAVPGVGTVILNEQIAGGNSVDGTSLTVNMIRVVLQDALTGAKTGEIVVGSASSAVGS